MKPRVFLQVVFIKSKVDPNVYIKQAHEIFFFLGGLGTHTKEPMGLFYKRTMNIFLSFFTFSYEWIFEWIFFQHVIKNTYSCPNRSHVLCQSLLNKYQFFKVCKFCQILHFMLKICHNFESYQNMWTTLGFFFLYQKIQLCFVCHAHYNPFTCGKRFLKF